ncbi:MAG: imidazole glycerol phosphate synthase subunit HisH [Succinivibrionaceae bacterium]|nr:imidazole glycerol phosphate synthase subunit HisH [Succinivibrionaceae bacterium]
MKLVIIDTGSANLNSVAQALRRLGEEPRISSDPADIKAADRLILPGVGTAAAVMGGVERLRLREAITSATCPLLGICLGEQILASRSLESAAGEGPVECLGIIKGEVAPLPRAAGLTLPHMGWNTVSHDGTGLFAGIPDGAYFYFVHSYALPVLPETCGRTTYGVEFTSALAKGNFMGVQFHPEKSGRHGAALLRNFLSL